MDRAKSGGCPRDHKSRAVGKSEIPPALHPSSDGPEVCNKLKLVKSFGIKIDIREIGKRKKFNSQMSIITTSIG